MTEQRIRILDEKTINQIAAGEVIESVASVIKELIENSLDANATSILIETEPDLIRVVDNGCGMSKEDLFLSLERHATSKIRSLEDLFSLNSLGFRGEALASIASISKVFILSAPDHIQPGHFIESASGKILLSGTKARQRGTTVEVRALFFNVPVRKKFQKSLGGQTADIQKVLTTQALCHPSVAFQWKNKDKEMLSLAGFGLLDKIQILLGQEFASALLPIDFQKGLMSATGFLSEPRFHKPNRTGQFLFINGRAVDCPFISRKILEGYGTRLPTSRYPFFVLYLTLPTGWIDVNVHPQKKEVRLLDEEKMGQFIVLATTSSLQKKEKPASPISIKLPALEKTFSLTGSETQFSDLPFESKELDLFAFRVQPISKVGKYLFIEREGALILIDLKAARERIVFEKLTQEKEKWEIQNLLIPLNLEFSESERFLVLENLEHINQIGISMRPFGQKTFIVDAIPTCFELDEIEMVVRMAFEKTETFAKRVSRALNREIRSLEEGARIVEELFRCKDFKETEAGAPIYEILTEQKLSKFFHETDS